MQLPSLVGSGCLLGPPPPLEGLTLDEMGLLLTGQLDSRLTAWEAQEVDRLQVRFGHVSLTCFSSVLKGGLFRALRLARLLRVGKAGGGVWVLVLARELYCTLGP